MDPAKGVQYLHIKEENTLFQTKKSVLLYWTLHESTVKACSEYCIYARAVAKLIIVKQGNLKCFPVEALSRQENNQ